jgi:hypothetical protein
MQPQDFFGALGVFLSSDSMLRKQGQVQKKINFEPICDDEQGKLESRSGKGDKK